jgi:hypothetical protein
VSYDRALSWPLASYSAAPSLPIVGETHETA